MKLNKYTISEASEGDLGDIEKFFRDNDLSLKDTKLFRWKYLDNPFGKARIFTIRNDNLEIKGMVAYLPRICVKPNSERFLIMQAVDVFIAPEARGQSLYNKLSRYAVDRLKVPTYGFANKITERIALRAGRKILCSMTSWYFPINIGQILHSSKLKFVGALINFISKMYGYFWLYRGGKQIEIRKISKFRNDFRVKRGYSYFERTADFLNWRFIDNPRQKYDCYEFLCQGEIIGYCVCKIKDAIAEIYDFITSKYERACLRTIIERFRKEKIGYIVFKCVGMNLIRYGFIKGRVYTNITSHNISTKLYFTLCDSDWD